jgi:hypothetical protein
MPYLLLYDTTSVGNHGFFKEKEKKNAAIAAWTRCRSAIPALQHTAKICNDRRPYCPIAVPTPTVGDGRRAVGTHGHVSGATTIERCNRGSVSDCYKSSVTMRYNGKKKVLNGKSCFGAFFFFFIRCLVNPRTLLQEHHHSSDHFAQSA